MSLLDEIEAADDVEVLDLTIPELKTTSHPEGVVIRFKGIDFKTLVDLQGTFDLKDVERNDLESMLKLLQLTAYDPETNERLFDSERGHDVLEKMGYKTLLRMVQDGATVVIGTDEKETAGKDSSSTAEGTPASGDSSSESPETQAEQWESF
jgi:hypothetical protein